MFVSGLKVLKVVEFSGAGEPDAIYLEFLLNFIVTKVLFLSSSGFYQTMINNSSVRSTSACCCVHYFKKFKKNLNILKYDKFSNPKATSVLSSSL